MRMVADALQGSITLQCMSNEGVTWCDGVHTTGYKLGVTSKTAASQRKNNMVCLSTRNYIMLPSRSAELAIRTSAPTVITE